MGIISLLIDTHDPRLAVDMLGNPKEIGTGSRTSIPGNAEVTLKSLYIRRAFGLPETLELAITFGSGVAAGLVANWLFDKLKDRDVRLRIEETEIQIEQGEIRRVITRKIEQQK
jgi:hypothetical protein